MKAGPGVKYGAFSKTTWNADACFDRDDLGLLARTMGLCAKQLRGSLLHYNSHENLSVLLSFVFSRISSSKEDISGNSSPSIVSSQPNNDRRPSDRAQIELETARDGEAALLQSGQTKLPCPLEPGSLDFESCSKLHLGRPEDHLRYFSTKHVTLRRRLILLVKLIELSTDAAP